MSPEIERLRHDIERHIAIASEHATECERLRAELDACKRINALLSGLEKAVRKGKEDASNLYPVHEVLQSFIDAHDAYVTALAAKGE